MTPMMEVGGESVSSESSDECQNTPDNFKTPGKNDITGSESGTPILSSTGTQRKPRKKKANAKANKARQKASMALLRSQEGQLSKEASQMKEKRQNNITNNNTPLYNKNYKDQMKRNVTRRNEEAERLTKAKEIQGSTPGFRDAEQSADTSARQEKRQDLIFRRIEQDADTSARQERRQDPVFRRREQDADTAARRKKRHSIRFLKNSYLENVQEGPLYPCACCGGLFFKRSLKEYNPFDKGDDNLKRKIRNDSLKYDGKYLACWTCRDNIVALKIPTLALNNGLYFKQVDEVLTCLNETERITLSPCPRYF